MKSPAEFGERALWLLRKITQRPVSVMRYPGGILKSYSVNMPKELMDEIRDFLAEFDEEEVTVR